MLVGSSVTSSIPAWADALSVQRGKAFARANCSRCHSIDRSSRSPHRNAPPFRTLHTRYPVESLEDALAEGISTGHPRMPEFQLDPGEVGDFIDFLKSLE
jgi:mono/diheme cytochrome c family protein